jgi:hypothetical protein
LVFGFWFLVFGRQSLGGRDKSGLNTTIGGGLPLIRHRVVDCLDVYFEDVFCYSVISPICWVMARS